MKRLSMMFIVATALILVASPGFAQRGGQMGGGMMGGEGQQGG